VPGPADSLYLNSRIFLAGLVDWSGPGRPTSEAIAGRGLLAQGRMHVLAIRETGSLILWQRDLELDAITGLREVSHHGGARCGSTRAASGSALPPRKRAAPCR